MSKQVLTPRFYVDIPSFLHAVGYSEYWGGEHDAKPLYINPSTQNITPYSNENIGNNGYHITHSIGSPSKFGRVNFPINFISLLNHNLGFFVVIILMVMVFQMEILIVIYLQKGLNITGDREKTMTPVMK